MQASAAKASSEPKRPAPTQCDEEEDHVASYVAACAEAADEEEGEEQEGGDAGPRRQLKDQKGKMEMLEAVNHDEVRVRTLCRHSPLEAAFAYTPPQRQGSKRGGARSGWSR